MVKHDEIYYLVSDGRFAKFTYKVENGLKEERVAGVFLAICFFETA